jgi:hypothetical protein
VESSLVIDDFSKPFVQEDAEQLIKIKCRKKTKLRTEQSRKFIKKDNQYKDKLNSNNSF